MSPSILHDKHQWTTIAFDDGAGRYQSPIGETGGFQLHIGIHAGSQCAVARHADDRASCACHRIDHRQHGIDATSNGATRRAGGGDHGLAPHTNEWQVVLEYLGFNTKIACVDRSEELLPTRHPFASGDIDTVNRDTVVPQRATPGCPSACAYRPPANAATSCCRASSTARSPNGMSA